MLNFKGPGGLNLAGGRGEEGCVCVCYREFVDESPVGAARLRSWSSVKYRHMIPIRVLHIFLLLSLSVYASLTKLWLWTEALELKLKSSPIWALINHGDFKSGWWMEELGTSWLQEIHFLHNVASAQRVEINLCLPLVCPSFPLLPTHSSHTWPAISHA